MSTDRMGPLPKRPPALHHPVVVDHAAQRAADFQLRIEAQELRLNTEITRAIHALTTEIHRQVVEDPGRRN